jgi:predicted transcriptional regulator
MDVFLNGILVASKKNVAPYMTYETITVGEKKGIEGGICNVVYYDHTLPNRTIKTVYNYLKNKEIPLF